MNYSHKFKKETVLSRVILLKVLPLDMPEFDLVVKQNLHKKNHKAIAGAWPFLRNTT
jgi:hypothetical protein